MKQIFCGIQLCFWEKIGNVYLCGLKEDKEYNHVRTLNAALNRFNKVNLDFVWARRRRQMWRRAALSRSPDYVDKKFIRDYRLILSEENWNCLSPWRVDLPYLPVILIKLVNFSIGNISFLQPNLNFTLFSSEVLPCLPCAVLCFIGQVYLH